jgi:hypothetical protein
MPKKKETEKQMKEEEELRRETYGIFALSIAFGIIFAFYNIYLGAMVFALMMLGWSVYKHFEEKKIEEED